MSAFTGESDMTWNLDPNDPDNDFPPEPDTMYDPDGVLIDPDIPMSNQERTLDALGKRFDRAAIKQRAGYGGKMLDYLATDTVIRRLNQAAQVWSFEIQSLEFRDNLCIVVGRLTIPTLGTRSGIGVQQLMQGSGSEDLVKGASSDALKKAATLFGVGLELYGPDLEALAAGQPQLILNAPTQGPVQHTSFSTPQQAPHGQGFAPSSPTPYQHSSHVSGPQNAPQPYSQQNRPIQASPNKPISEKQLAKIWGDAKRGNVDAASLHAYVAAAYDGRTLDQLSSAQASEVIDWLKGPTY